MGYNIYLRLKKLLLILNFVTFSSLSYAINHDQCLFQKPKQLKFSVEVFKEYLLNEIVAIVNDQVITRNELNTEMLNIYLQRKEESVVEMAALNVLNQGVLHQMINQSISLKMAERQSVNIADSEVHTISQGIIGNITFKSFEKKLKKLGISFELYFNAVKKKLIINKLQQLAISEKVYILPSKLDNYLSHSSIDKNTLYQLKNISLPLSKDTGEATKKALFIQAWDIVQTVKSKRIGFVDATKKYSQNVNTQSSEQYFWKTLFNLPSLVVDKVKKMKTGEISPPFILNNGIQIMQLVKIKGSNLEKNYIEEYKIRKMTIDTTPMVNHRQAKAKLMEFIRSIDKRVLFSTLVKLKQKENSVAFQGGDLGWVTLLQLPIELKHKLRLTKLNKISLPFQFGNQWHIIEVIGYRERENTQAYKEEQAAQELLQESAEQAFRAWEMSLREGCYIKILDPRLNTFLVGQWITQ